MAKCSVCGSIYPPGVSACEYCGNNLNSTPTPPRAPASTGSDEALKERVLAGLNDWSDQKLLAAAKDFYIGKNVKRDKAFAGVIFGKLAFRGLPEAMFYVAELMLDGEIKNVRDAIFWYKKAAALGHAESQGKLEWYLRDGNIGGAPSAAAKPSAPAASGTLAELAAQASPSIVRITAGPSSGTGFIVEGGIVVTNHHVIRRSSTSIKANFSPSVSEHTYALKLIKSDPALDIALLEFTGAAKTKMIKEANNGERSFLTFRTAEDVRMGEPCYTIGNSLGLGLSLSAGHIASDPHATHNFGGPWAYTIHANLDSYGGNSGGAVMDYSNRVLGMLSFSPTFDSVAPSEALSRAIQIPANSMSYCVPAEYIMKFIKNNT